MEKTVTVTVCNVCERVDRPANTFYVRELATEVRLDLCEEHSEPLRSLLATGERVPVSASQGRRRQPPKVMTLQEIEAAKRKSRNRNKS